MTRQQKKEVGLVITTFVISVLLFWWIAASVSGTPHPFFAVLLVLASLIWVAFIAITLSLAASNISRVFLTLGIPLIVIIIGQAHVGAIGAALLLVLPLSSAQRHLVGDIKNRIKYNTAQIFSVGTRLILIGLVVVVAGLSAAPLTSSIKSNGLQVPQQFVELTLKPAEGVISNVLPGYTADRTVDQLIEAKFRSQAHDLPPDATIPPQEYDALHRDLSQSYGLPVTGHETVPALVTTYINQSLIDLTKDTPLLSVLLALVAFLLVARLVIPILLWPTMAIISLLVYLAQRADFLFLITSQEPVERLRL